MGVNFAHVVRISERQFPAVCILLILVKQGVELKLALQLGQTEFDF